MELIIKATKSVILVTVMETPGGGSVGSRDRQKDRKTSDQTCGRTSIATTDNIFSIATRGSNPNVL